MLATASAMVPGPGKTPGSAVTILPILPHWQLASDSELKAQPLASSHPLVLAS